VRFDFQQLPGEAPGRDRARPVVEVVVNGLDWVPVTCLVDSGAQAVRLGLELGTSLGVEVTGPSTGRLAVAGILAESWQAEVSLSVGRGTDAHRWDATIYVCDPFPPGFGLLGLTGFFDQFLVTIDAYEEWLELAPVSRS
jgi:hypothetical protein